MIDAAIAAVAVAAAAAASAANDARPFPPAVDDGSQVERERSACQPHRLGPRLHPHGHDFVVAASAAPPSSSSSSSSSSSYSPPPPLSSPPPATRWRRVRQEVPRHHLQHRRVAGAEV